MNWKFIACSLLLAPCISASHAQQLPPAAPEADASPTVPASEASERFSQSEDWSALPLDKSGLNTNMYTAVVLAKWETPEYTRELIHVQWRPVDPIDLYVVMPHGVKKAPAILYMYDYRFDTDRFRDDGWCQRATRDGFAAVAFGSALSKQRFHSPRPMREWFVSQLQEALGKSTHDVQMVLNYLATREDIDMTRVGMFAQGSGGAIAILAAAVDSRIAALDLLEPWGDWPDWLKESPQIPEDERATYLKPDFLAKVAGMDPVTYLPRLKAKALRIQQILDDPITPNAAKNALRAAVRNPGIVVRYQDPGEHMAAWRTSGLTGWLRDQLQPAVNSKNDTASANLH